MLHRILAAVRHLKLKTLAGKDQPFKFSSHPLVEFCSSFELHSFTYFNRLVPYYSQQIFNPFFNS